MNTQSYGPDQNPNINPNAKIPQKWSGALSSNSSLLFDSEYGYMVSMKAPYSVQDNATNLSENYVAQWIALLGANNLQVDQSYVITLWGDVYNLSFDSNVAIYDNANNQLWSNNFVPPNTQRQMFGKIFMKFLPDASTAIGSADFIPWTHTIDCLEIQYLDCMGWPAVFNVFDYVIQNNVLPDKDIEIPTWAEVVMVDMDSMNAYRNNSLWKTWYIDLKLPNPQAKISRSFTPDFAITWSSYFQKSDPAEIKFVVGNTSGFWFTANLTSWEIIEGDSYFTYYPLSKGTTVLQARCDQGESNNVGSWLFYYRVSVITEWFVNNSIANAIAGITKVSSINGMTGSLWLAINPNNSGNGVTPVVLNTGASAELYFPTPAQSWATKYMLTNGAETITGSKTFDSFTYFNANWWSIRILPNAGASDIGTWASTNFRLFAGSFVWLTVGFWGTLAVATAAQVSDAWISIPWSATKWAFRFEAVTATPTAENDGILFRAAGTRTLGFYDQIYHSIAPLLIYKRVVNTTISWTSALNILSWWTNNGGGNVLPINYFSFSWRRIKISFFLGYDVTVATTHQIQLTINGANIATKIFNIPAGLATNWWVLRWEINIRNQAVGAAASTTARWSLNLVSDSSGMNFSIPIRANFNINTTIANTFAVTSLFWLLWCQATVIESNITSESNIQ